jgi:4'-phosphopantetheinyl transferase EntD
MKNLGVAVSFPESYPMAIDIEAINTVNSSVIKAYFTENELSQISGDVLNFDTYLTLLWTVKEGLAKVLKCGLLVPLSVFEVSKIAVDNEYIQSFFKNFSQYQALSFISGDMVCSIVYPSNANISFNIKSYKKWLYTMCDIHDI